MDSIHRPTSPSGKLQPRGALPTAQTDRVEKNRARMASTSPRLSRFEAFTQSRGSVAMCQGLCYLVMGLWPLIHMASLEHLTGPKHDATLMQVTGAMLTVVGTVLLLGSSKRTMGPIVTLLGGGMAGVLGFLGVAFVVNGHMSHIYLLDAALESAFIGWWTFASAMDRRAQKASNSPNPPIAFTTFFTETERNTRH